MYCLLCEKEFQKYEKLKEHTKSCKYEDEDISSELFEEFKLKNKYAYGSTVVCIKRKNDKIIQDCDVYIGRRCEKGGWNLKQSKWANPFKVKDYGLKEACKKYKKYKKYVLNNKELMDSLSELKGKRLGCWCKKKPTDLCHGDILLELIDKYA